MSILFRENIYSSETTNVTFHLEDFVEPVQEAYRFVSRSKKDLDASFVYRYACPHEWIKIYKREM